MGYRFDCRLKKNRDKRACQGDIKDYPLQSKSFQLKRALKKGNIQIRKGVTRREFHILQNIVKNQRKGNDTLKEFTNKDGSFNAHRSKIHDKIIKEQFKGSHSDYDDPDLYIFGGLPASGKTSALQRKVPEHALSIDSDEYKLKLAKYTKSPIKRFVLAHAGLLHEESDILVKKAIDKAIKERKDVILDRTFGSLEKGKKEIERFKKAGYDIHYLATQKYPHKTMPDMAGRFLSKGRYVPLEYVFVKGNQISKNSWLARKMADDYQIFDTNTRRIKLITKSKKGIKYNYRNPKN